MNQRWDCFNPSPFWIVRYVWTKTLWYIIGNKATTSCATGFTLLRQSQNSETRHDEQKRGFVGFFIGPWYLNCFLVRWESCSWCFLLLKTSYIYIYIYTCFYLIFLLKLDMNIEFLPGVFSYTCCEVDTLWIYIYIYIYLYTGIFVDVWIYA